MDDPTDLHDFHNYAWLKDRVRPQINRNSYRYEGAGQNVTTIPANTFLPIIAGIPTQGQSLVTTTGTWTQGPTSFSYQWLRDGVSIGGATSNSYTLQAADVGHGITVAVVATNRIGNSSPVDAKPVGPIAAPLTASGTPVLTASVGAPYAGFTVSGAGGWPPYTFNVTQGLLPRGITMGGNTGIVAGIPLVSGNSTGIVITVSDRYGETATLPAFSILVSGTPLVISGTPVTTATIFVPYAGFTVSASGSNPPYTYAVTAGSLPTGITLDSSTGIVSGTPTVIQTQTGIIITATDSTSIQASLPAFQIAVTEVTLTISGTPVTSATLNQAYAGFTATAAGGVTPYVYSVSAGALPTGITLNSSTGVVSGTPTVQGSFPGIVITVTDNLGYTASLPSFTLSVLGLNFDSLDFSKKYNSQYLGAI